MSRQAQTEQTADQVVAGLFREHGLSLVRLAVLLTGDQATAEDVVQDAFLGFQRAWPRLRDESKALAYLRASVVNGCRSVLRRRGRVQFRRDEDDPPVSSAETAVMAEQDRRLVLAAVRRLPVRTREILALRYYLDLPYEEIARPGQVVTDRRREAALLQPAGRFSGPDHPDRCRARPRR